MSTRFYGLTGGIGSGKSTVAQMFATLGVPTLDLDHVGHAILETDNHVKAELVQKFGSSILDNRNNINRSRLAELAFKSPENTAALNHITHTAIRLAEQKWRNKQKTPLAIIEASVLIESGGVRRLDGLIIVMADLDLRKQRVLQRGKQSASTFQAIIKHQCSDQQRLASADMIIKNNLGLKELKQQVNTLYKQLIEKHESEFTKYKL